MWVSFVFFALKNTLYQKFNIKSIVVVATHGLYLFIFVTDINNKVNSLARFNIRAFFALLLMHKISFIVIFHIHGNLQRGREGGREEYSHSTTHKRETAQQQYHCYHQDTKHHTHTHTRKHGSIHSFIEENFIMTHSLFSSCFIYDYGFFFVLFHH